ncbi:hypothetical protein FB451DRAFT_1189644 [Mycena latifolia]|nr:hypothetical protein FB451DRAFT_1189644 [Mycena latifolia]
MANRSGDRAERQNPRQSEAISGKLKPSIFAGPESPRKNGTGHMCRAGRGALRRADTEPAPTNTRKTTRGKSAVRSRKATAEPDDAGEEQVKPGILRVKPEAVKDEEAEPVLEALASCQPSASAPMAVEPVVEKENENEPGEEPEESAPAVKVRVPRSRKVKEEVREPDVSVPRRTMRTRRT